ncbi:MAG: hypothetical protein ACREXR_21035 [Gammaproteobacteria bacterium]
MRARLHQNYTDGVFCVAALADNSLFLLVARDRIELPTQGYQDPGSAAAGRSECIRYLPHCLRPKTVSRVVSSVRLFLQFLVMRGILQRGLSQVLPTIRVTRANLEMKRKAPEKVADVSPLPEIPSWKQDKTLLEWLHSLSRRGGHASRLLTEVLRVGPKFYVEFYKCIPWQSTGFRRYST